MSALLLALAACAGSASGSSLGGSGLLTLPDTATLAPGRIRAGVAVDNRDRDPLGLDLLDASLVWTVGLAPRLETYGRLVASRVVSLPEPPPLPVPPLDLVVAPGASVPAGPLHSFYAPTPYVDKRGRARLDAWIPGDAVVGAKWRLRDGEGLAPALAVSGELKLPLGRSLPDLQSGSGTGGVDAGARLGAQWRAGAQALIASAAWTHAGRPALGDRIIEAQGARARTTDVALDLPDRLDLGVGVRRSLARGLAALGEAVLSLEVGGRTPVLDARAPLDLVAGVQARWGRAHLAAALRYHGHGARSGMQRGSPLAGLVDLTSVGDAELTRYLSAAGAAAALPHLRPGAQRALVPGPEPPALPAGARFWPSSYALRSEHQVGFIALWQWEF